MLKMISNAARYSVTVSLSPSKMTIKTSVTNGVNKVKLAINEAGEYFSARKYKKNPSAILLMRSHNTP